MLLQIVIGFFLSRYGTVGQGIWCGVFFLLTGGLGVSAANKPSQCSVITVMVFSIISAVMAVPHMVFDAFGAFSPWGWV